MTAALSLSAPMLRAAVAIGERERPNIVVLFADDLGYGDISSYGCPDIRTPVIDSIGKRGVRFTRFYSNAPECSPSRVALLTGRYQQRVGGLECAIGVGNLGRYDEAEWLQQRGELGLPASETTIAEMLRRAGYDTAIIGKWHLGYEPKFWPHHHGFQESLVLLGGLADYFTHREVDNVTLATREGGPELIHNGAPTTAEGYLTDVFADRAIDWISSRRGPYFLYLPFTTPHSPYQGPNDRAAPLRSAKQGANREELRDIYRQMIEHMDKRIGDILAAIGKSGSADNTIVVFLSDNGANQVGRNLPYRGFKAQLWEGGIRVPCVMSWPGRIPAGTETTQVTLNMDLTATLLAAAGVTPPAGRRLDGVNLLPGLQDGAAPFSRTVFWRYKRQNNRRKAVLDGDLKLVIENGQKTLFDIAKDATESHDLSGEMPGAVAALEAKLTAWEAAVAAPRLRAFQPKAPAERDRPQPP